MKMKYILSSMVVVALGLFTACNDAEYEIRNNSVYLVEASSTLKSAKVPMNELTGADPTFTVRLAKPVAEDVEVSIAIDPSGLAKFNEVNASSYHSLPIERTDLGADTKIVIKAGEVSVSKKVHVDYFDTEGKLYALPIAVNVLSGNVEASVSQSKFIFILAKKLNVVTPNLKFRSGGGASINAKPLVETDGTGGWNLSMSSYTLEFWARLELYNSQNFAIFSIYGNDSSIPDNYEFYFRFGDANSIPSENGPRNYINWKAWGAQLTGPFDLVRDQWNHWAAVYDGTSVILYRNGMEYLKTGAKYPGSNWVMHSFNMIESHQNTNNTMNLSQIRLWKKALSPIQIRDNMYYEVDVTNPDLEAYWKMDEGPTNFNNIFYDATGHGHDAILHPERVTNFGWTAPQNFE